MTFEWSTNSVYHMDLLVNGYSKIAQINLLASIM